MAAVDKSCAGKLISMMNETATTLSAATLYREVTPMQPFTNDQCIKGVYNKTEYILNSDTRLGICFLNEENYNPYVYMYQKTGNPIFFSEENWGYILVDAPFMNRWRNGCRSVFIPPLKNPLQFEHCVNTSSKDPNYSTVTTFTCNYASIVLDSEGWNTFMGSLYDISLQMLKTEMLEEYCNFQSGCNQLQNCPAMEIVTEIEFNETV